LEINDNENIPEIISNFTPEENLLMIQIGSHFVKSGISGIVSILSKEIFDEKQKEIDNLCIEIELQKKYFKDQIENLDSIKKVEFDEFVKSKLDTKDVIIDGLKKQIETFSNMLENKTKDMLQYKEKYENEYNNKIQIVETKLQKDKEFFDKERERNERTFEKLQELLQSSSSKTSVGLGIEGEITFNNLAERAFRDFEQYYIKDVSKESSKGDYHLFFKEFSIMVDTKNYLKTTVNNTSKKKIKVDIENNKHIPIAWLVSLHGNINGFNKFPIMFEFIDNQCIFYVNHLLKYQEPVEMLRLLWSVSNSMYSILCKRESKEEDFQIYKTKVTDIVKELEKINREENNYLLEMSKNIEKMKLSKKTTKEFLCELLNENINEEINEEYENILQDNISDSVKKWSDNTISTCDIENRNKIKFSEIWEKYKNDPSNKRYNMKRAKLKEIFAGIFKEHTDTKTGDLTGYEWK
jgi:hypothetical protein